MQLLLFVYSFMLSQIQMQYLRNDVKNGKKTFRKECFYLKRVTYIKIEVILMT